MSKKDIKIGEVVYTPNYDGFYTVERVQAGLAYLINFEGIRKVENLDEIYPVQERD